MVYLCLYMCVCVCVCVCVCACTHAHMCMRTCVHACVCVHVHCADYTTAHKNFISANPSEVQTIPADKFRRTLSGIALFSAQQSFVFHLAIPVFIPPCVWYTYVIQTHTMNACVCNRTESAARSTRTVSNSSNN